MMIKVIRYAVTVIATLGILLLIWQFRGAIVLFFLSLAVAALLRPFIDDLSSRLLSKRLALGIVYGLVILGVIVFFLTVSPLLLQDLQNATNDFIGYYDRAKLEWAETGSVFQKTLAEQLPPSTDLIQALTSMDEGVPLLTGAFTLAQNFFSGLGNLFIVIILSLYWSADQLRFERLGLSLLPDAYHSKALQVWRSVEVRVGAYLRGELVQSVLTGLIVWLGYATMGIRYPVLLALWVAVVRLIPWFGALIAVIPAVLIGIGTSSVLGLLAALYTIFILLFAKLVIEPRFFRRQRYSALLIVLFVIAMAGAFGFIGMVLAPPLAVALQILFEQLYPFPEQRYSLEAVEKAREFRKRLADVRSGLTDPVDRKNIILMNRIQRLVRRTVDHVEEY
jgi:predicted PurR-regulated permease PerM